MQLCSNWLTSKYPKYRELVHADFVIIQHKTARSTFKMRFSLFLHDCIATLRHSSFLVK